MKRRQFIKRGALLVPATFGIFLPRLIRAQVPRPPYPLASSRRSSGCSGTIVDTLIRFDAGTNGNTPTVTELNNGTFGLSNGTWTRPGAATQYKISTAQDAIISGLKISDGSGCGDPTTKCLSESLSLSGDDYPLFTFGSSKAVICYGFAVRVSSFGAFFPTVNMCRSDASGGQFFSCSIDLNGNNSTLDIYAHGNSTNGTAITGLAADTWWWIAMKRDSTTSVRLRVYSLPGLVQQQSESVGTLSASSTTCTAVRCGKTDPAGTATGATVFWDDIAMRFADVHPLLPT